MPEALRSFTYTDSVTGQRCEVIAGRTWVSTDCEAYRRDPAAFGAPERRSAVSLRRAGTGSSVGLRTVPALRKYVVTFASRYLYEDLLEELGPDMDGERAAWCYGTQDGDQLVVRAFLPEAHTVVDRGMSHIDANPLRALRHSIGWRLIGHAHSHPGGRSRPSDEDKQAWAAWLDLCQGSAFASLIVAHEREGATRPGPHGFITRRQQGRAVTERAQLEIPRAGVF